MPQPKPPVDLLRAEFQDRHSGLLTDLLAQYTRFVQESPPVGERQMPERLQHLLRMVRVTGRNFLNEREPQVHGTGLTRDEILEMLLRDADAWLEQHGPDQDRWVAPFAELEATPAKRRNTKPPQRLRLSARQLRGGGGVGEEARWRQGRDLGRGDLLGAFEHRR